MPTVQKLSPNSQPPYSQHKLTDTENGEPGNTLPPSQPKKGLNSFQERGSEARRDPGSPQFGHSDRASIFKGELSVLSIFKPFWSIVSECSRQLQPTLKGTESLGPKGLLRIASKIPLQKGQGHRAKPTEAPTRRLSLWAPPARLTVVFAESFSLRAHAPISTTFFYPLPHPIVPFAV